MDANRGGRYVFRYNVVNNSNTEAHSVQGNHRATRSWEIYNNQFNRALAGGQWVAMGQRGGTGVIFDNTITGAYTHAIVFDNVRSFTNLSFPPGPCDGNSSWDGNEVPPNNGWPCRDQFGRSTDEWLFDQAPFPPQASEPTYLWNNTHDGQPAEPYIHNCVDTVVPGGSCTHIQENRDYFLAVRPGYAPFTYPHPLREQAVALPAPPRNLGVVVR
jgi:hypothetical protein